jgi:hypothetical protein
MEILSGVIGVLVVVVLILRIAQMTGGTTTTIKTIHGSYDPEGNFHPGETGRREVAPLPARSGQELQQQAESMVVEWVTYPGATPPLRLKIRGATYEMYRRVARKYIDQVGQDNFERLSMEQIQVVNRSMMAEAYVLDWEGAQYPNGAPKPFLPASLALLLNSDPHLEEFLIHHGERISPKWDLK